MNDGSLGLFLHFDGTECNYLLGITRLKIMLKDLGLQQSIFVSFVLKEFALKTGIFKVLTYLTCNNQEKDAIRFNCCFVYFGIHIL